MVSISSAADEARVNLRKIEHFVVLMLENRSFDQMLGYLEFEGHDVGGLKREDNRRSTCMRPRWRLFGVSQVLLVDKG